MSSTVGPEYYVAIMSFVDKTQLEPGCSVLLHNKTNAVVGILSDEADPMVSVMKVSGCWRQSVSLAPCSLLNALSMSCSSHQVCSLIMHCHRQG